MNYFLDLMYQLLAAPRQALRTVTRGEKLRQAALLWLFVNFLLSLSAILEGPELMTRFFLSVIVLGMGLFLHSAVTDYCAGFLGGRGTAKGITAGFMAASFPYAFAVFGSLFGAAFGFGESLLASVLFLWSFVLDVTAISENYGFSTGKALLVALIPYLLFAVFFMGLFFAGLAAAVSGLAQMDDAALIEGVIQSI